MPPQSVSASLPDPTVGRIVVGPRRRVVGGEFEIAPELLVPGDALPDPLPPMFAAGRAAFRAVLNALSARHGVARVLLPDYLCESMVVATQSTGLSHDYYSIGPDLLPDQEALSRALTGADARTAVVLIDYFGLAELGPTVHWLDAQSPRPSIVIDAVQAPFRPDPLPSAADYAFNSLRKALPTPDGAAAFSRHEPLGPATGEQAAFVADKLLGNVLKACADVESMPHAVYLQFTELAEHALDEHGFYEAAMSHASRTILSHLDIDAIAMQRRRNFTYLAERLSRAGISPLLPLAADAVPLFLPVLLPDRDGVRTALATERIFCPVHWPEPEDVVRTRAAASSRLYRHELSLIIDQRYDVAEMDRIADIVVASA